MADNLLAQIKYVFAGRGWTGPITVTGPNTFLWDRLPFHIDSNGSVWCDRPAALLIGWDGWVGSTGQ